MQERDAIPLPIQRKVRQRCGFGCVICGFPLYEYEHMEEWAKVKRHLADEITLLCDQHHREKTSGLLPKEVVIEANKNPHNLKNGVSKPYNLHYNGNNPEIEIGSTRFITEDKGYNTQLIPILIDNIPIIGIILADGHFLLNMVLFDENNKLIFQIKNNVLAYKVDIWDIQLVGTKLIIRQEHRKILIEIEFKIPNKVKINRGKFLYNGIEVNIKPDLIKINNKNISFSGGTLHSQIGLTIGNNKPEYKSIFDINDVNRYCR